VITSAPERTLSDHVVRGALDCGEPVLNDELDDFKWLRPMRLAI